MNIQEANEKIKIIESLALEIELDEELKSIDERYSIAAKWCDMDIENVDL